MKIISQNIIKAFMLSSLIIFIGCNKTDVSNKGRFVVVSIYPLKDIAARIAGNRADVEYIIPSGANPHYFEPSPSSIRRMQNAVIFIGINAGFDGWIEKFIPQRSKRLYIMQSQSASTARNAIVEDYENPHIWLSIAGAKKIADKIFEILTADDPEGSEFYKKNLDRFQSDLSALNDEIKGILSWIDNRSVIEWHPAWVYFADEFNIKIIGTIENGHGAKPSVRHIKELIFIAKQTGTKIVIKDAISQSPEADAIASEINGSTVLLDTIGAPDKKGYENFFNMMRSNAKTLAEALKNAR
jgi:zinc transport system substrate-binding protein